MKNIAYKIPKQTLNIPQKLHKHFNDTLKISEILEESINFNNYYDRSPRAICPKEPSIQWKYKKKSK
jgi:hypothetical protein